MVHKEDKQIIDPEYVECKYKVTKYGDIHEVLDYDDGETEPVSIDNSVLHESIISSKCYKNFIYPMLNSKYPNRINIIPNTNNYGITNKNADEYYEMDDDLVKLLADEKFGDSSIDTSDDKINIARIHGMILYDRYMNGIEKIDDDDEDVEKEILKTEILLKTQDNDRLKNTNQELIIICQKLLSITNKDPINPEVTELSGKFNEIYSKSSESLEFKLE